MAGLGTNYVFAFNNWLFGGPGQGVQVMSVDGLKDLPSLRTQDDNRGYADGMFTGRDFLDGRYLTFTLSIMSDSSNPMSYYIDQLKANLVSQTNGTGVLQFTLPDASGNPVTQRLNARVRRRSITIDPLYVYGKATAVVQFFCPDPRVYSDTATTYTLSPSSGKTRSYNRTYNMTYPVAATGGSNSVTFTPSATAGNYQTFPVFTFTGPSVAPSVQAVINGTSYNLSFPAIALGSTDTLVVNNDYKTVLLNGSASRNLLASGSTWFAFTPGVSTTISYAVTSGTGSCSFTYRDANI